VAADGLLDRRVSESRSEFITAAFDRVFSYLVFGAHLNLVSDHLRRFFVIAQPAKGGMAK
jgi:hypothetical protein